MHTKNDKGAPPKEQHAPVQEEDTKNTELTDKQRLFCLYYVKYWNATKAYQKTYECTYEVANKNAYNLMVNYGIKNEIERLKNDLSFGRGTL